MRQFEITSDSILYKGKPGFLIGADIHYFRINPKDWRDRIQKALDCGCNIVSVYIPWMAHEIEEGRFDFTGETHPRRNIIGFLELLKEMDVATIAKPGPFVYSELPGQGVPTWWIAGHPNTWAKWWNGEEFVPCKPGNTANISYLHPQYLEAADRWLAKICNVIAPFQRSASGSVEAVQVCNEIAGQHIWNGSFDANPDAIEFGKPGGLYATFFQHKYGSLENLNKIHAHTYTGFDRVPVPMMRDKAKDETRQALAADYADFYWNCYIPKYMSWLVDRFRSHGITEQLATNIAFPEMVVDLRQALANNPTVFAGIDLYYTFVHNKVLGPRTLAYCCEYGPQLLAKVAKRPPVSLEFQAGAPNELEYVLYEPHAYIWAMWSFIGGYQGLNLYVIAGGNNIPSVGREGTTYDYQAPISATGELRGSYHGFQRAFREVGDMPWLLESEQCYDLALAVCDQSPFRDNPLRLVCEGLFRNSYSPEVLLLDEVTVDDLLARPAIWTSPGTRLAPEDQSMLIDYARRGGTLILSGEMPTMDLDFQPCTLLLDELGIKLSDPREGDCLLFNGQEVGGAERYWADDKEWLSVIATTADGTPSAAGYAFGKGKVVVIPFEVGFGQLVDVRLFKAICEAAGLKQAAWSDQARVLVRRLPDGSRKWLALNYHPISINETIEVDGRSISVSMEPFSVKHGTVE